MSAAFSEDHDERRAEDDAEIRFEEGPEILEADANIDNLVLLVLPEGGGRSPAEEVERSISSMVEIRKRTLKPVMAIFASSSSAEGMQQARKIAQKLQDGGIPAFITLERGARALKNALDYHNSKNNIGS